MTPLEAHLRRRIAVEGAISVADYMGTALGHPQHGYYITRDPLGRAGDFTTAPEISQMFGELIGLWCAEIWGQIGMPGVVHLVEFGPGRGTLMADLLRAGQRMPGFLEAVRLHFVETSPVLREAQARSVERFGLSPTWHEDVTALPEDAPLLFVANEFFDALPIHQMQKTETGWRERLVMVDPETDRLAVTQARGSGPLEALIDPEIRRKAGPGRIVELAPAAWRIAGDMGVRLARQGGAALLIDYGYEGPATGDTLQAVKAHNPCDILETPGEADLTAHVDFTALAKAAGTDGVRATPVVSQGDFLRALGIEYRAKTLMKVASSDTAKQIAAGRDRLILDQGMGTLFKVVGLAAEGVPPLPGLEAV